MTLRESLQTARNRIMRCEDRSQKFRLTNAGREVVGSVGGRLAAGGGGGGEGAAAAGAFSSSGQASCGADPVFTVLPYSDPALAAGFAAPNTGLEDAEGAAGFAAGVGAFLRVAISTLPMGA